MKHQYVAFFIVILIFFGFWFSRDFLAGVVWEKYNNAELAITLLRTDEGLAMDIGDYYFNGGAYDLVRARRAYQRAAAIDPAPQWAHFQLGRLDFVEGNFETALVEIEKERSAYPNNLRSLYALGLIYSYRGMEGDLEKAEKNFTQFTQWAPMEWAGYNDLAWILARQEKYAEAEKVVENAFDAVVGGRENPWLWNGLGIAQLNNGTYAAAIRSFEQALFFAEKLTFSDWQRAYPGNDPREYGAALYGFKEAIEQNIERARTLLLES